MPPLGSTAQVNSRPSTHTNTFIDTMSRTMSAGDLVSGISYQQYLITASVAAQTQHRSLTWDTSQTQSRVARRRIWLPRRWTTVDVSRYAGNARNCERRGLRRGSTSNLRSTSAASVGSSECRQSVAVYLPCLLNRAIGRPSSLSWKTAGRRV